MSFPVAAATVGSRMFYELREQYLTPEDCEPYGLWHIVEAGRRLALCGHTVDTKAAARTLADLADIAPGCRCDPCLQIHHGAEGRALNEDWQEEAPHPVDAGRASVDPGPW